MDSFKTRCRIVLILFAITAGLTFALNGMASQGASAPSLESIPLHVGLFHGQDMPVENSVKDILETPNVIMRRYYGPEGEEIDFSIVYYEGHPVMFHMPEGCMTGKGSVIIADERESLGSYGDEDEPLIANKLILQQPDGKEHVYYFFIVGDLITPSYTKMRLYLMSEYLKERQAGAALVRFSTRVALDTSQEDAEEALEILNHFVGLTIPVLRSHLS